MITINHCPYGSYVDNGDKRISPFEAAYALNIIKSPHPVPAIILKVEFIPDTVDDPFHSTIIVWEKREICNCCGGLIKSLVAMFDFDFDRSCDFFLAFGSYMNIRQIDEGLAASAMLRETGGQVQ